jgi:hypothetical protein
MPAESRRMSEQAARELLLGLAEEALSGRGGDVTCLWGAKSMRSL